MPVADSIIPRGYLRTLPPRARTVIREHRRRLLRDLTGRVLDLGGDPAHRPLYPASAEVVAGAGERDGRFDHVVSIFYLTAVADPAVELAEVREHLAPEGTFVFLEPVVDTGLVGRGQRLVAPVVGRVAGWRPDRDVPALLRDARLVMSDLVRTPMPRHLWPLTELVEGRAHHRIKR
jgi:SAM-dependent methyltransferase